MPTKLILLLRLKKNNFENKYNKELSDLALLRKSNEALAFALASTMFSIAGIPPMIGFFAKMSIFLSVVGISFYFIALVSIVCRCELSRFKNIKGLRCTFVIDTSVI